VDQGLFDPAPAAWSPETETPLLKVAGVSRRFGATAALHDVSFSLGRGQVLGIIGRSGAGKSTLIRCLNGLERPDSGTIAIEGREVQDLTESQWQTERRRIGMIFQHFNLLSSRTALENVALPLKLAGVKRGARLRRAADLLDLVGLGDKGRAYPAKLSGGQKQRVGIARALASDPALLLCDEATSALDPETTVSILGLLRKINREMGLTIVLITHEMNVARRIADRVMVLASGRVVEEGPVRNVLTDPQAEETQILLRAAALGFADGEGI
jgi:D-methionine transport system ATP-binding protein